MENLTTFQASQVNDVFKNLELLSRQPNKKVYSKPYLFCEKFVPQEFVAGCDVPNTTYYKVDIKAVEADGVEGWSDGDVTSYAGGSYYLFFDKLNLYNGSDQFKTINGDTYPNDGNHGKYYEFTLGGPGVVVYRKNSSTYERKETYPSGTKFYWLNQNITSNNFGTRTVS